MTVSGVVTWRTSHSSVGGIAVATLLLDLMGVRNTWQLVMWIFSARLPDDSQRG
jgi:hypothetical protein